MNSRNFVWNAIPRLFVGAGVLAFVAGWLTWESLAWRRTYNGIKPGMTLSTVQTRFNSLKPPPRFCELSPGGFWKQDSSSHLIIAGPNRWKYCFYLDADHRVIDKVKWWG